MILQKWLVFCLAWKGGGRGRHASAIACCWDKEVLARLNPKAWLIIGAAAMFLDWAASISPLAYLLYLPRLLLAESKESLEISLITRTCEQSRWFPSKLGMYDTSCFVCTFIKSFLPAREKIEKRRGSSSERERENSQNQNNSYYTNHSMLYPFTFSPFHAPVMNSVFKIGCRQLYLNRHSAQISCKLAILYFSSF